MVFVWLLPFIIPILFVMFFVGAGRTVVSVIIECVYLTRWLVNLTADILVNLYVLAYKLYHSVRRQ